MRKFHLLLVSIVFLVFSNKGVSQNTLAIGAGEINTGSAFDLAVSLTNNDPVSALQFDINFDPNAFELQTGHLLSSRAVTHTLGVSSPSP